MSRPDEDRDPLEVLAAEFIERQRSGQYPSISEYTAKHPELAADIQELFPAIAAVERLKIHKEEASGARVFLGAPKLERLGDFRILSEIGRGGMGIVYEAFQESLGRHVAVKVLPRQSLLDPKHLHRFEREAQTAARLHHTNIVPVFGVGEQEGFHYIVMQLIRGVGLDRILDSLQQPSVPTAPQQHRSDTGAPRGESTDSIRLAGMLVQGQFWQAQASGLASAVPDSGTGWGSKGSTIPPSPLPEGNAATEEFEGDRDTKVSRGPSPSAADPLGTPSRVESWHIGPAYWRSAATIGLQVAEALHYAHAHQTLHRDIKPANLLLDSQGVVWITDFGLAKAMEQDRVTQTGVLAGTLRYMAPEQFSGAIDARSDIYSLGLTLYELLTLRPAFEDTNRSSLIRKVTHDEPVRPRKLMPGIPRDLETIVLKAIARDPADRYQSAGDLARDLQCFLEDRPILARRAPWTERLWRWSRRNRAIASLAASTLVLLITVAMVASVGYLRTKQARDEEAFQRRKAEETSALALEARKKAEETSALALEALDNIFQQFAPDRTAAASALVVVSEADGEITVPVQPVLSKEAAALLEHMLVFYDRLARQGGDDARLRRKVAEANRRVGDIRQRLGDHEESKAAYLRAIELYAELANASVEDVGLRTEIARIHNELGNVYGAMEDPKAGHESYTKALSTLKAAPAELSDDPQYRYELARTYYFLGKGPPWQLPPPPQMFGGERGPGPGPPGMGFNPPGPRRGPGGPNPDRTGPDRGPRGPELDSKGEHRGPPDRGRGRGDRPPGPRPPFFMAPKEREDSLRKAIGLLERLVDEHPAVPDYRHLLARCYREVPPPWPGRGSEWVPDAPAKAASLLEDLVADFPDVPDYRFDLSETYAKVEFGRPFSPEGLDPDFQKRSREMLEKALKISEELVAEHPNIPDYAVSQVNMRWRLGLLLWKTDQAAAEATLRKALDLQSSLVRRYPTTTFYKVWMTFVRDTLAGLLLERGRFPEARSLLQESIASLQEVLQSDPNAGKAGFVRDMLGGKYMFLAGVLRKMGDEQAAAEAVRQAETLREAEALRSGR